MADQKKTSGYFVFNGDADGICAAHQLRLSGVTCNHVVTGVKRDISLLKKVKDLQGEQLYVMDISVEKNLEELAILLEQDCSISWFDHHHSEVIPDHKKLSTHINTSPTINTSLLVCRATQNQNPKWAIVGLFGDNMYQTAEKLSSDIGLQNEEILSYRELGDLVNYNAYGSTLEDLHFTPEQIFEQLKDYIDPQVFIKETDFYNVLKQGREDDLLAAQTAERIGPNIISFPFEKWARRVVGIYANQLIRENPDQPLAIIGDQGNQNYMVSVRIPPNSNINAAEFCKQFPTGGGRNKAAGINALPDSLLNEFIDSFKKL